MIQTLCYQSPLVPFSFETKQSDHQEDQVSKAESRYFDKRIDQGPIRKHQEATLWVVIYFSSLAHSRGSVEKVSFK